MGIFIQTTTERVKYLVLLQIKPRIVIRYSNKVYKFLTNDELDNEFRITEISEKLIHLFCNRLLRKYDIKFRVLTYEVNEFYVSSDFIKGVALENLPTKMWLEDYLKIISFFELEVGQKHGYMFGDFSVANVIKMENNEYVYIDQGSGFLVPGAPLGSIARGIHNLLERGVKWHKIQPNLEANHMNSSLNRLIFQRAKQVFFKRLSFKTVFSAIYRYFIFVKSYYVRY